MPKENDFLNQLKSTIEQRMSDESFGVTELAEEIGMSRSNLLRRIKKLTGQSVSQFIREVRLAKAMELLHQGSLNVSEVAFQVGFSSVSYFVKCFRETYGYPPGEASKQVEEEEIDSVRAEPLEKKQPNLKLIGALVAVVLILAVAAFAFMGGDRLEDTSVEKSIAVLPFKNDSDDKSNVYLINGLMESTLINLQKIGALKVISRTSVEQYRDSPKAIPKIADELDVNYFVEGSGQKIGDRIMLNIQLIEAATDQQLWAAQYERDAKDIFKLQQEIASNIANEIKAIITPTERKQIIKVPTDNLLAYDNYLKGRNLLQIGNLERIEEAIPYFEKAIRLDDSFAAAYASLAFSYYYLELFQSDRKHVKAMNEMAQKAMALDPELPESHVAMALCEKEKANFDAVIPYLERALELRPNSAEVINLLSDMYANYTPNTEKYLEYALKGVQLSRVDNDSITTSYIYLHLSNALIQSGFVEESIYYVNRSIDYYAYNGYSQYVKAFMLYARDKDEDMLRGRLITEWEKDSARIDILQEIGKVSFFMRDYETAYHYYDLLLNQLAERNLDVFQYEFLKVGMVYEAMGEAEKGQELIQEYYDYVSQDETYYRDIFLYVYYAYKGEAEPAIEHLKAFSEQDSFQFWLVLFDNDPSTDALNGNAEVAALWKKITDKFWDNHERLKTDLKEKGLI